MWIFRGTKLPKKVPVSYKKSVLHAKTALRDTFFLCAVYVLLLATKSAISSHFIALYGRELVFFFSFSLLFVISLGADVSRWLVFGLGTVFVEYFVESLKFNPLFLSTSKKQQLNDRKFKFKLITIVDTINYGKTFTIDSDAHFKTSFTTQAIFWPPALIKGPVKIYRVPGFVKNSYKIS